MTHKELLELEGKKISHETFNKVDHTPEVVKTVNKGWDGRRDDEFGYNLHIITLLDGTEIKVYN